MNPIECGAKTRTHGGLPCRMPAMTNGRCRLHGGKSTGAKTAAGLARIKAANTKHGFYSAEAYTKRKVTHELISRSQNFLNTSSNVSINDPKPSLGRWL